MSASPSEFPVQLYELSISDVIGELRLFKNVSATTNCTSVGDLFENAACLSFNVSIRAYNGNGYSKTTSILNTNSEIGMIH